MGARTRVSLLILLLLGLHAIPVLSYQGYRQTRWPILTWAMYARSYPAGPIQLTIRRVDQVTRSGQRFEVTAGDIGLANPTFSKMFMVPLAGGDSAVARDLMRRLNAVQADSVARLEVELIRYELADTGVVRDTLQAVVYPAGAAGQR